VSKEKNFSKLATIVSNVFIKLKDSCLLTTEFNLKNLFFVSFMILLYLLAFFWGGYYPLTPATYLAGFLGIFIISAWIGSCCYSTRSLLCLVLTTTLVALFEVGTISFFSLTFLSPLKILGWSILTIFLVEVANFLEKITSWWKSYPKNMRILPVFLCLIPLFILTVAQAYLYTYDLALIIVYVILLALSFVYTSVHTLQSNFMAMISSLFFCFIIEFVSNPQRLLTFGFNEPLSLLTLFSWPIRTWTIYLLCGLAGCEFGRKEYDVKEAWATQSLEQICSDNSIIVVADTHFGLYTDDEECDPNAFADFLKWIKKLETKTQSLDVGDWFNDDLGRNLDLKPPAKIIFLGDILEFWTASNESILASTIYIIQLLSELNCEKIYLLGNHDNDLISVKGRYPLGTLDIEILEEDEYWIEGKEEKYCFLHGHQFDRGFSFPAWKLVVLIRKAALVFGNYSFVLVGLFFASIALCIDGSGGFANVILTVLLGFFSVPFIFIKFARKVFNRLKTIKFDWMSASESADQNILDRVWSPEEAKFLNVVYGHTHTIDDWTHTEEREEGFKEELMRIMNLPSWLRKPSKEKKSLSKKILKLIETSFYPQKSLKSKKESIKEEISHVFLYISKDFSPSGIFIGWDAENKKPYYIPPRVVYNKHVFGNLSNSDAKYEASGISHNNVDQKLADIHWPEELRTRWMGFQTGLTKKDKEN
jgi:UDP-2,3-diacylglucosamine pyrophosphatase LpxH